MKVGDLVMCYSHPPGGVQFPIPSSEGLIVGFGKKGEGGKDYVHVLISGKVQVFMRHAVEVINESR